MDLIEEVLRHDLAEAGVVSRPQDSGQFLARLSLLAETSMRLHYAALGCATLAMNMAFVLPDRLLSAAEPTPDSPEPVPSAALIARPDQKVDLDVAKWQAQASATYISSGAIAFSVRMIDGDPQTAFRFSGADLHPTVIVQLARSEEVHRVSALFDADGITKLEVYLLGELPKRPGDLDAEKPLIWIPKHKSGDRAAINFVSTHARYVAFRWTRQRLSRLPFAVAEVSAFSVVPAEQLPLALAEPDISLVGAGTSGYAPSDRLGAPAELPVIAVVSP
jgi:hypothetical protein